MTRIAHAHSLSEEKIPRGALIVLDTNILIQIIDDTNPYCEQTRRFFGRIARQGGVRLVYFLASRLELREYVRKRAMTLFLRKQFGAGSEFLMGNGQFDTWCNRSEKIVGESGYDLNLTDRDIKELRAKCFANFESLDVGVRKWKDISRLALKMSFRKFKVVLKELGIEYVNLFDKDLFPEGTPPPRWEDQETLMVDYGLGSSDASILNMARACPKIYAVITNDGDIVEIFRAGGFPEEVGCYTFLNRLLLAAA